MHWQITNKKSQNKKDGISHPQIVDYTKDGLKEKGRYHKKQAPLGAFMRAEITDDLPNRWNTDTTPMASYLQPNRIKYDPNKMMPLQPQPRKLPFPEKKKLPDRWQYANCGACRHHTDEMGHVTLRDGYRTTYKYYHPEIVQKDKHMWVRSEIPTCPDAVAPMNEEHRKYKRIINTPMQAKYELHDTECLKLRSPWYNNAWRMERQPAVGIMPDRSPSEINKNTPINENYRRYETRYYEEYYDPSKLCLGFWAKKGPFGPREYIPNPPHDRRFHCATQFSHR